MKEYWEITQERGVATLAVWSMQTTFELRGLTLPQHTTNVGALTGLAQTRAAQEGNLSDVRAERDDTLAKLRDANVRVPGIIDGVLTADDDLHGQLDLVYAVETNVSQASDLRRARLLGGLWADFNAKLAADTPPKPPLILAYKKAGSDDPPVNVTQENLLDLIEDCEQVQSDEAAAIREVSKAKTALRTAERKVDRDNKRWYLAWLKMYPPGTPEGDAAKNQVPAEQGTPPPNPLDIVSLTVNADRTVTLLYPANGGEHATTLELQWRLPGDEDFGHSVAVQRPQQTVGPFTAGATVTFRTRGANSTPGVILGEPKTAIIPAG